MYLEFEIKNNQIKRKNIEGDYKYKKQCSFSFLTKEWKHKEKYVIFWTENNKSIIRSLGHKSHSKCRIPKELTNIFSIQVYANDNLYTNKLKIGTTIKEKQNVKKKLIQDVQNVKKDIL